MGGGAQWRIKLIKRFLHGHEPFHDSHVQIARATGPVQPHYLDAPPPKKKR
jgi:hypothetical protein